MNIDLLNLFRFINHGVDTHQMLNQSMPDDLYNAVAFAQANPDVYNVANWVNTAEWQQATQESIAEIIGNVANLQQFHMFSF